METLNYDELKVLLEDAYNAGQNKIGFNNYFEELINRVKELELERKYSKKNLPTRKPPYNCPSDGECIYPNCECKWLL